MEYKELDDTKYSELRSELIDKKGSDKQLEFLEVVKDNKAFIEYIEDYDSTEDGKELKLCEKLTEFEFKEPTKEVENELYDKWDITPAQACRTTFWGKVTLEHIKNERINAYYLAANGGTLPGGLERIDEALKSGDTKKIDSIVRTVIRRMSGLPEARGIVAYMSIAHSLGHGGENISQQKYARSHPTPTKEKLLMLSELQMDTGN